eukprot:CAMPEP_0183371030 /NCGR_PEP_ID=MMETSP0164_2-20130417/104190_1 /TAXON_ID=221442 /ORGANISM="Coccolithus pelagicus ssp braarudi, Strain PLY182g" /LENGTH=189 /DNA_ID=CAMNT_0025547529 /DNA_START=97 /DNA_END=667 /DNA_ORIENTATION=+
MGVRGTLSGVLYGAPKPRDALSNLVHRARLAAMPCHEHLIEALYSTPHLLILNHCRIDPLLLWSASSSRAAARSTPSAACVLACSASCCVNVRCSTHAVAVASSSVRCNSIVAAAACRIASYCADSCAVATRGCFCGLTLATTVTAAASIACRLRLPAALASVAATAAALAHPPPTRLQSPRATSVLQA